MNVGHHAWFARIAAPLAVQTDGRASASPARRIALLAVATDGPAPVVPQGISALLTTSDKVVAISGVSVAAVVHTSTNGRDSARTGSIPKA